MIDGDQFRKRTARLEEMLQAKLGVKGKTLERRLQRAGRLLPRRARSAGHVLAETERKLVHPTLMKQIEPRHVALAFNELEGHLMSIDPAERRKNRVLHWAGGTVVNLIIVVALVAAFIHWKGLI